MTMSAKVAYLILAHEAPEALHRLLWRLNTDDGKENRGAYIHIDKKVPSITTLDFREQFPETVYLENRVKCIWGSFNICEATINLMRAAYESDRNFDHFALLSGQCYPVQPLGDLEAYLAAHPQLEFITASPMEVNTSWVRMLNERYIVGSNNPNKQARWRYLVKNRMQRVVNSKAKLFGEPFKYGLLGGRVLYKGSQWLILTRTAIRHILETHDQDANLRKLFNTIRFSSEQYFHTIVGNSPLLVHVRPSVTFTDWTQKGSSPTPINLGHALLLRHLLKKDPNRYFFARKVTGRSMPLYDVLDELPGQPRDETIEHALDHWY